ncbi:zinc-containing alcohol dehydrogenase [Danaus plexippus plexippus]|uniref:Zinc-containing alcohol dehydrogenase n=1 Tax=Danaus plexippus plexippus TaxID=278856 RepID=A0A212EYS2_DANPL|nr:zinc-containing alcohol dehydrogenase [Danaus plexippus plexippus]
MKALIFDGKKVTLTYGEFPMPKLVHDTDVIVKVHYAGVCGTDLHIIQGEFPAYKERPLPLGHEFSGVIHAVGEKSIFKVGQKVVVDPNRACDLCNFCRNGNYQYCKVKGINDALGIWRDGGWAEYVLSPQNQVYALPDGITIEQAALCEPFACVSHGVDLAQPLPIGKSILVVGAGIIGNMWTCVLHLQGHRDVTVSEMNKSRLEIVKKLDTGFRLVTPDVLEAEKRVYDVIIDCTGVGKVIEINFKYMNNGGKYILFGCCPPTHTATLNPFDIYNKELSIIGVKINPFSFPKALGLLRSMGDRYLKYEKLGVKTYPLSDYQQALDDLKTGNISKAIFTI